MLLLIKSTRTTNMLCWLRVESFYVIFLLAKTELRLSGQVGKQCRRGFCNSRCHTNVQIFLHRSNYLLKIIISGRAQFHQFLLHTSNCWMMLNLLHRIYQWQYYTSIHNKWEKNNTVAQQNSRQANSNAHSNADGYFPLLFELTYNINLIKSFGDK